MKTDELSSRRAISTGGRRLSGTYTTPVGNFITYHKRPTRHMANGDIASNGFDFPGVPWVLYITEGGISFHGTYWHNDYGIPHSHGCINMTPQAAKWLYRWTMPTVPPEKVCCLWIWRDKGGNQGLTMETRLTTEVHMARACKACFSASESPSGYRWLGLKFSGNHRKDTGQDAFGRLLSGVASSAAKSLTLPTHGNNFPINKV